VALKMARAAIEAADPEISVLEAVRSDDDGIAIGDWSASWDDIGRVIVVGAGKAACPMARAIEDVLDERIDAGVVVTKDGSVEPTHRIQVRVAAHPVPDQNGVDAASEILELVSELDERDLVIVLLSGGGSALLVAPADGISLDDKQITTNALLASGATIHEINTVRKHFSRVKGGQLARACGPAAVVTLALSDVIGDSLDVIASGPTVPDTSTYGDALAVIDRYGLRETLPKSVVERFRRGAAGDLPETPKPGDDAFRRSVVRIVGSNRTALTAAADAARANGYEPRVLTSSLRGEAREVANVLVAIAEGVANSDRPCGLICGGETTVTLGSNPGTGGRNQELALAAALEIDGRDDIVVLSVGTDGTDGPTDAAGGIVDGESVRRAREAELDVRDALRRHDAYPLLAEIDDLVVTGPTGTNVMDVVIVLVG
jgi:hydroxypyruvate reductase